MEYPKTFVINLKHRKDRYSNILNELSKVNIINYQIIEAFEDKIGYKGCLKSHQKCVEIAKLEKLDNILILEDDAIFTDNFNIIFENILKELTLIDWDLCFLGVKLENAPIKITNNIYKLNNFYLAHAYLVNKKFFNTIINFDNTKQIDTHYNHNTKNYNFFTCFPIISFQKPNYSDIEKQNLNYNYRMINS